ncbi:MAG: methyltransferase domain-containing protein [Candidatus Zixiibacteriota bacterium]
MHDPHQEFFDSLAAEWDLHYTAEDLERLYRLVNRLPIADGMDLLDLGCGTGILFDMLRRRVGPGGLVTGVDFSIRMAQKAHRNFPFSNVTVVDADAAHLPFRDSSYDLAISFAAFPHFTHKDLTVKEAGRVLKAGAPFYIIHLVSSKELADIHFREGGVVKHDQLPSELEMKRMFADSGFGRVEIEDHPGLFLAAAVNIK